MGILNKSTPIQTGKVYSTLNQPEIFVEYTGEETSTATTTVDNTTKKISVTTTNYVVTVSSSGGEISQEDFNKIAESTSTKVAVIGIDINVICSAAENRADTDTFYKYYGPADASGYGYVVKVSKTPTAGAITYHYIVTEELIALMKEDFVTTVTVGGIAAGTSITKGTNVADLLQTILQGETPTTEWKFKYIQSVTAPTEITSEWSTADIPSTAKLNGYEFYSLATPRIAYIAFAFNKDIGILKHIYQNEYDILGSYFPSTPIEVTYDNIVYYVYIATEKSICEADDKFKLVWIDEEK